MEAYAPELLLLGWYAVCGALFMLFFLCLLFFAGVLWGIIREFLE